MPGQVTTGPCVRGGGRIPEDHRGDGTSKYVFLTARLLLRRKFSFRAFSYDAYFRSAPSPMTLIFIPRLLLWRTFFFRAFSYDVYFCSGPSPTTPIFIPCILL